MGEPASQDFDRDIIATSSRAGKVEQDLRGIVTAIARSSHEIAYRVSLGRLAPLGRDATKASARAPASTARDILMAQLGQGPTRALVCAGEAEPIRIDGQGLYDVTIDPLEGTPDPDANLPFGTIFSIASATQARDALPLVAGFIHYGPQTNLVLTLMDGVHVFNLDWTTRTYRLVAEDVRIPAATREWAIDATKRGRWPATMRELIDEQLEEADAPGAAWADMRWTGSLVADAFRILQRGGVYLCPEDDQAGREASCPRLVHAARPIAVIVEQAGGRATTGYERLLDRPVRHDGERTPLIFGARPMVERIERLHALPDRMFETSPLFRKRGLFQS